MKRAGALFMPAAEFPRMSGVGNSVNRGNLPLTASLYAVMFSVGEVEAKTFALNVGHLRGERSQWCNRLLQKVREVAREAHTFGVDGSPSYGSDDAGDRSSCRSSGTLRA